MCIICHCVVVCILYTKKKQKIFKYYINNILLNFTDVDRYINQYFKKRKNNF